MQLTFLDWSLPPTLVPWKRFLASLGSSSLNSNKSNKSSQSTQSAATPAPSVSPLLDLWENQPAQYYHGLISTETAKWLRFLLAHAGSIDSNFLHAVITSFTSEEWSVLRTNSCALTPSSWKLIRQFVLDRCTYNHLPKATTELELIDWLIDHNQLFGDEPEVKAVLDIILDPEIDGTPGLLAIPCYPLLQRLATLPLLPDSLVIRLSQVALHLAAPRGPKKHPLLEPTIDIRTGLLTHPACTEDIVLSLMQHTNDPAVFLAIAMNDRWGKNRIIQQTILILDRLPVPQMEPIVRAITQTAGSADLISLFSDIELALKMQGKDPLPLLRLFVRILSPEQAEALSKKDLAWLLKNPDREIRASTALLFKHRTAKKGPLDADQTELLTEE